MAHIGTTKRAKIWEKYIGYSGLGLLSLILIAAFIYSCFEKYDKFYTKQAAPASPNCFNLAIGKKGNLVTATNTYRVRRPGRINMCSDKEYWFINGGGFWLDQEPGCEFIVVKKEDIGGVVMLAGKKRGTMVCLAEENVNNENVK